VNAGFLQSTLREMQVFLRSRNLWLIFAAVVLLFAFIGPYGTMERLPFLERLFYWLVLQAGAWSLALSFAIVGNVLLVGVVPGLFWRLLLGSLAAALPIALLVGGIQRLWFGSLAAFDLLSETVLTIPLCGIFCVISYLAMTSAPGPGPMPPVGHQATTSADGSPVPEPMRPGDAPLVSRLKPENRGVLRHLSVEDHYTMVTTSRGRELILLRFSDAIRETGDTGLQVHRSHWVACDFVESLVRDNGRLQLRLRDGSEIPVSRTYAGEVRARFADRP
jgi:DNA-binding LytR/AlgR family response regulator